MFISGRSSDRQQDTQAIRSPRHRMTRTGYSKRGSFPPLHRHTHNSELWQHVHYNNPNYPEWPGFLAVDGGSFVERGDDGQGALCNLGKRSTRVVVVLEEQ